MSTKEKAAAAPKPAKKEAAAKPAPKPEQPKQNDVTRPAEGTKTGRVWAIADKLSADNKTPAERAVVMEAGRKEQIPDATIATQYGRWRRFNGLFGRTAKPVVEKKATKAAKTSEASA